MSIYNVFNDIAGVKYNEHLILNKPLLLIMLFVAVFRSYNLRSMYTTRIKYI